jgi:hypothetical protein
MCAARAFFVEREQRRNLHLVGAPTAAAPQQSEDL